MQQGDTYQQIIPGIPQDSLYPTFSALSSGPIATATNEHSLRNKVTKGLDQYFQEAEQLQESEDNYFDGTTRSTNSSPILEAEDQEDQTQNKDVVHVKWQLFDTKESSDNIPESHITDTGYSLQHQEATISKPQANIDLDDNLTDDQL